MKGLLITLFLMLVLLYEAVSAQNDDPCFRAQSSGSVAVDVGWCSKKVTANLPSPVGYCSNGSCKSSHRTHTTPDSLERSK